MLENAPFLHPFRNSGQENGHLDGDLLGEGYLVKVTREEMLLLLPRSLALFK